MRVRLVHRRSHMPLREFTDRTGRRWRVWDIRPEQLHAATRAEDYLQSVINGWLAFEPAQGGEKRRLAPIPARWDTATEAELDAMLERAEVARSDGFPPTSREAPAAPRDAEAPAAPNEPTTRTFRYPAGRFWTVNEVPAGSTSSEQQPPLLRFTSGARSLDASDWPSGWGRMSETDLADLLFRSFPRDRSATNPTGLRRRRSDIA